MTVKEFYEWAVKNGVEDYKMVNWYWNGKGDYSVEDWEINEKDKEVSTNFEC